MKCYLYPVVWISKYISIIQTCNLYSFSILRSWSTSNVVDVLLITGSNHLFNLFKPFWQKKHTFTSLGTRKWCFHGSFDRISWKEYIMFRWNHLKPGERASILWGYWGEFVGSWSVAFTVARLMCRKSYENIRCHFWMLTSMWFLPTLLMYMRL